MWAEPSEKPKSNIGDITLFDLETNPSLLQNLTPTVVMVGLNISRSFSEPFRNFHDPSPKANDFKIRYAFQNTEYYGAYMTDIIKNIERVDSNDLLADLKEDPALSRQNVAAFREELHDVTQRAPIILAFGSAAHAILARNLREDEYSALVKLTHYSHYLGKEAYRDCALEQIESQLRLKMER